MKHTADKNDWCIKCKYVYNSRGCRNEQDLDKKKELRCAKCGSLLTGSVQVINGKLYDQCAG